MEYRRRKSKRRSSVQGSSNTAKAVIALIIVAAAIYFLSASAAGTWIAEKVFAPMFTAVDGLLKGTTPAPTPGETGAPEQNAPASNLPAVTDDVDFPVLECFALQMGVFNEKTNAEAQATELKGRGAGGYVLEDSGRFRVIAAAYSSRESLDAVREQLSAEGMESAVHVISANGSTLRITATQEQLDEISAGFSALALLVNDMSAAALEYDKQNMTPSQGRESAAALLARLQQDSEKFHRVAASENAILSAASECFKSCEDALSALASYQTQSTVDFASKMKYTHISVVCAYTRLSNAIKAAS